MRPTLVELLKLNPATMNQEELRVHVAQLHAWRTKDFGQLLDDEEHGRPEHQGFIYILSNPAMPGLLKIGFTIGPVEKRAAELSTTGVPERFKKERAFPLYVSPKVEERKVHRALSCYRASDHREFFRLSVDEAVPIIQAVLDGTFDPP